MEESLYLGFDVGTQSTKGVVLSAASGQVIAKAAEQYGLIEGLGPGAAEQHPDTWVTALRNVTASIVDQLGDAKQRIRGIGVSGQQHGLVVLDSDDRPVRAAKLWCDTTTAAEADDITKNTRWAVPTGYTSPKMLWMKRNEPALWSKVRSVMLPHDYINFVLTGDKFTECGEASGSGVFDPKNRRFDVEAAKYIDENLPEMLPRLLPSDAPGGTLSEAGAKLLGLSPGIAVSTGGGDNMMSAIGSGATHSGVTIVSLGTSGTAFAYSDVPVIDPEGLIAAFCDSTGAWMPLMCTMNVTGVTEEVSSMFGQSHEQLAAAAQKVAPGADGLLLLPYFQGERVPNLPDATATLMGLRPGMLNPGHLYRAAIEGTTLAMVSGIARMKRLGLVVDAVRIVGGGSKSSLWRQILADMLQVPVARLVEPESAALGAAIQAQWVARRATGEAVGVDEIAARVVVVDDQVSEPNAANAQLYQEKLQRLDEQTRHLYM